MGALAMLWNVSALVSAAINGDIYNTYLIRFF